MQLQLVMHSAILKVVTAQMCQLKFMSVHLEKKFHTQQHTVFSKSNIVSISIGRNFTEFIRLKMNTHFNCDFPCRFELEPLVSRYVCVHVLLLLLL